MKFNKILKLAELLEKLATSANILESISQADNFSSKLEIAEKNYKHLSQGSSRAILIVPPGQCLKVAKNEKGIAQNLQEAKIPKSKYINGVVKSSKDGSWIICKLLEDLTEKKFEELTNINFKDFSKCIKYELQDIAETSKSKPSNFNSINKKDIFKEIVKVAKKYKLLPGDIGRISSWKLDKNTPKLVDCGLTRKIYDKYYSK